jgi:ubiquinol-cytochrome c reductase cytochrome b subunit
MFYEKACINCHMVEGFGGKRGPDLTYIGDKLQRGDMVTRIVNGGVNMPAFGSSLKPEEIDELVTFLQSRKRPVVQ